MAYVPVTLPTPTLEVSPQGGGTIAATATTSGSFSDSEESGAQSAFKNYRYTATPNPGYRFVRFDVYVQQYAQYNQTYTRDGQTPVAKSGTASGGSFVYETTIDADYLETGSGEEPGSAWWWYFPLGLLYTDAEIKSIRVVAVFELRNSGLLVYDPNQNGQLVYSPSQGGALVYDG